MLNKALKKNAGKGEPEQAPSTPSLRSTSPVLAKGLGNSAASFIGYDITVVGNLVSKGDVQIEG